MKKRVINIALRVILILVLVVAGYIGYAFIDYSRIPDNMEVDIDGAPINTQAIVPGDGTEYSITSWNIGFAAYTSDFGFFMDGGTESRAKSETSVIENMNSMISKLKGYDSDFYFIQEIDTDSDRAHHVNELEMVKQGLACNTVQIDMKDEKTGADKTDVLLPVMSYAYAENYHSMYLAYPIFKPIGASDSGILTLSSWEIRDSLRRSLPIQTGFAKFLDLDRCYDISRVELANGKDLVLINFHLSAYTTDATIVEQQLYMLYDDMVKEYEKGNYIIAGGDFNKDLLGNSGEIFGISGQEYSWAQSYPFDTIPEGFELQAPYDAANPVASCRNADGPWDPATQFHLTIDGFLTSDNIEVGTVKVIDENFENSDHNPVNMTFRLK